MFKTLSKLYHFDDHRDTHINVMNSRTFILFFLHILRHLPLYRLIQIDFAKAFNTNCYIQAFMQPAVEQIQGFISATPKLVSDVIIVDHIGLQRHCVCLRILFCVMGHFRRREDTQTYFFSRVVSFFSKYMVFLGFEYGSDFLLVFPKQINHMFCIIV